MGSSGIYPSLEEKYYKLMDWIDAKGIPVYKAIDFIESKNIPSFPVAVILVLLVLAGLIFLLMPVLDNTVEFQLTVNDETGNSLQGVTITYVTGEKTLTQITDKNGTAILKIEREKDFEVSATKNGFKTQTKSFNSKNKKGTIELETASLDPIKVQLLGKGNEVLDEEIRVSFTCSGNNKWNEIITFNTGSADLENVPADCGKILANPIGKECTEDCDFDSGSSLIKIYLEDTQTETGTINFSVLSEDGDELTGIKVMVIPTGSTIAENFCMTYTGICETEVPYGTYYIRATDSSGEYQEYNSKDETTTVSLNSNNQIIYFDDIILEKGVIGQVKVRAKDTEGNGIDTALIKLYRNDTEINQQRTNASGEAVFNVAEQVDYVVSVTHANYLNTSSRTVQPGNEFIEFTLEQATSSNSRTINVTVLDEKSEPVENTKVFLKDAIKGSIIGQEKVTGFNGKVEFEKLEEGKYIVRAEKRGFEGKDSPVIEVKEKEPKEVTINLNIGIGTLDVIVLDAEKQAIQSATVKVIDYYSENELYVDSTDVEGKKSFSIRADKKVYLEVNESSHSNYISAPIQMFDGTEEKIIVLESDISSFGIKLEELSALGQEVENSTLSEGKTYKAKFKLMIPKGMIANNTGVHIRTGADTINQNNAMEKDDLYLKEVIASNAKIVKGTTFNPNTGYSIDSSHLTTGNAKWANVIFDSVKAGIYEIEAVIQVRESLNGSPMNLAYRAWAEANGFERDPYDDELKESESTGAKQSLYAKVRYEPLKIGASSLCEENFCSSFRVKDLQNATTTNIIDEFPAEISTNYELEFNIISINNRAYSNSELVIEGKGIEINSYEINGKKEELKGTETEKIFFAEDKVVIKTGSIAKGEKIAGTINFTTKKEGTNRIDLSLFGESPTLGKEKILFKPIKAEVKNAESMNIETVPKNLVPFIENNLLVKITDKDGDDLSDVEITIKKDNDRIAFGQTDSDGVYAYSFESMNAGTIITITAVKSGFNTLEKEIIIQENIVMISPPKINETLNIKQDFQITRDITLKNITEMPLTINAIDLTNSFKGLIDVEIQEFNGELIIGNEEQIFVKIGLTEKGKKVKEVTSLNGEIILVLENFELEKQWTASIPIEITIGLGGEVDSADCFILTPSEWSVLTENKKKEKKFVLANTCTINEEPIELKDIKAKVVWQENEIGNLELSLSEGESAIKLTNTYKTISESMKQNSEEENLTISFTPDDIKIGSATATIYIEAVNPTDNGEQKLKQKIEIKTEISELSECLRILPTTNQIRISMNYWNQGYGYMNNYIGYNPMNTYSSSMDPNYLSSINRSYPYYNYPYDPNASAGSLRNNSNVVFPDAWQNQQSPYTYNMMPYSNPTGYNTALNYQWGMGTTGTGTIQIENNCPSTVQIEIEGDSGISVSDSTIALDKGGNKTIEITPTMFIGQYPITIRAKLKDSTDTIREVAKYNVLVESELGRNYYDCISLSTRVFSFNDVIQKPVEGIVWNTCYDLGVRLTQNSIPTDLSSGANLNYASDYNQGKTRLNSSGIIKSIELIQLVDKPGTDGKIIQELKFRMRKNLTYLPENQKLPTADNPLIELAQLRIKLTGLYYAVEAEERLPITFYDRSGMQQIIPFDITIEDLWALAGQDLIDFGNPNLSHQDCIIKEALNFEKQGCFSETIFQNGISQYIDSQRVIYKKQDNRFDAKKEKAYCADSDSIAKIINNKIEDDSGIILNFTVEDGDKIKLSIDKRNMKYNPVKKLSGTLLVRLSRVNPLETKTVSIPYSLCLEGLTQAQGECKDEAKKKTEINEIIDSKILERITKIERIVEKLTEICSGLSKEELNGVAEDLTGKEPITEVETCDAEGITGTNAYSLYGFDKIKLDWKWENIAFNQCDTGNTYCDSTQFAIELNKKAEQIKLLNMATEENSCIGYCTETDSENLYRFALEKTEVKDETTGEKLVFFIDAQNSIIKGKKLSLPNVLSEIQTIADVLKAGLNISNAKTITSTVDSIIKMIENDSSIKEENIVGEINTTGWTAADRLTLTAITGGDKIGNSENYLITFKEYKALRTKLIDCTNADPTATECTINNAKTTTTFLNKLQKSIEFKKGIRNTVEISAEDKQTAIEKGKTKQTIETRLTKTNANSLEDFYEKNIEFNAFLKKDGLSTDFKTDFAKAYTEEPSFANWTFNKTQFDSGKYSILFNYDWKNNAATEIKMTFKEGLNSNYQKNYLFSIPFDGETGMDTYTDRKGYGTSYGTNSSVNNIYLNENIILRKNTPGINTGLVQFSNTNKLEKLEETRNGRILNIIDSQFVFAPSKPLGLKAITEGTKSGVFYELTSGGTNLAEKLDYLLEWDSAKDSKQKESTLKQGNDCQGERFGAIFGNAGTQTTLIFVPASLGYKFAKYCNTGIKEMTGYNFNYKGELEEKNNLPGTASFTSDVEGNIEQKTSIKQYIEEIKTAKVCFTPDNDSLLIEWNTKALIEEMS